MSADDSSKHCPVDSHIAMATEGVDLDAMFAAIDAAGSVRMTGPRIPSPRASGHVRRAGQPSRAHVTLRRHPPHHARGAASSGRRGI